MKFRDAKRQHAKRFQRLSRGLTPVISVTQEVRSGGSWLERPA
jgi:hypothetical protein